MTTDNFIKHKHKNPLQQLFLRLFFQKLFHIAKQTHAETILDVGCGEGFTLNKLKKVGIGKKLEGIEYSKEAIALGKKFHPDIHITQGTIYDLPYKANTFDMVICTEVLEHLEEPEKAFAELVRVSKKYCLLSVPNEPFFMMENFLRGKNITRWGNDREHIQHWTRLAFRKFIAKKLKIKTIVNPFPFAWTIVLGQK